MSRAKSFDRARDKERSKSRGSPRSERSRSPNQTYLYDQALKQNLKKEANIEKLRKEEEDRINKSKPSQAQAMKTQKLAEQKFDSEFTMEVAKLVNERDLESSRAKYDLPTSSKRGNDISHVYLSKENENLEEINFDWAKFSDIMFALGFVPEIVSNDCIEFSLLCKMWIILEADSREGIKVANLRYFCKAILGLIHDPKKN